MIANVCLTFLFNNYMKSKLFYIMVCELNLLKVYFNVVKIFKSECNGGCCIGFIKKGYTRKWCA